MIALPAALAPYVALTKPRILAMVLFTTAAGAIVNAPGALRPLAMLAAVVATAPLAAGAAALNQWYERESDGLMRRTRGRPIPSGRLPAARALWFGVALSIAGLAALWLTTTAAATAAGAATLSIYVLVYTPLKRRSSACVVAGALAGAMPPIIGALAVADHVTTTAVTLFAALFAWQIPHVSAIALMLSDDYERAGLRMLPFASRGTKSAGVHLFCSSCFLLVTTLFPVMVGSAGVAYAAAVLAMGMPFAKTAFQIPRDPSPARARRVVLASVAYLPALFIVIALLVR
jgi:heme o synthase